jgi:peptidoglycan/xylan/chitin deacetylase (PgdA/CDA1 family)
MVEPFRESYDANLLTKTGRAMNPGTKIWQKIERRFARFRECQNFQLKNDTGIVCFTFDDVPRSACIQGSAILEKRHANGTYYVCGEWTDSGDCHSRADLRRLVDGGHELGCHGFAHRSYQSISEAEILADIRQNRSFLQELGCDAPKHFAYPYGHVSPSVKRIVGREFISSRGVQPGINCSTVDLRLLKSFPLYQHLWTQDKIARVIEENARLCGLLIFFVHGVRCDPTEHDCTGELLDFAVQVSTVNGNRVLPVGAALSRVGVDSELNRPASR